MIAFSELAFHDSESILTRPSCYAMFLRTAKVVAHRWLLVDRRLEMIFLTVGSEPFDRLVVAFDNWLQQRKSTYTAFAQIANANYLPKNCGYKDFLSPDEYQLRMSTARLIVTHAGIGTIIAAYELRKRIVLLPRRASHDETRNDHQLATVKHLRIINHEFLAMTESDLPTVLDRAMQSLDVDTSESLIASQCDPSLIDFIHGAIQDCKQSK